MPASITDLRVGRATSFNDGSGWFFSFRCSPEDFERIRQHRQLTERTIDWQWHNNAIASGARTSDPWHYPLFEAEKGLGRWDGYKRPPEPFRGFVGPRMVAVTNAERTQVYIMRDYWRYPHAP